MSSWSGLSSLLKSCRSTNLKLNKRSKYPISEALGCAIAFGSQDDVRCAHAGKGAMPPITYFNGRGGREDRKMNLCQPVSISVAAIAVVYAKLRVDADKFLILVGTEWINDF